LGRGLHALITIHNAAREGARYATKDPKYKNGELDLILKEEVITVTMLEATQNGIHVENDDVIVDCPEKDLAGLGCWQGSPIRVTVSHDFELVMSFVLPSPIKISRYVEMMLP
jgi:hypothetical protein